MRLNLKQAQEKCFIILIAFCLGIALIIGLFKVSALLPDQNSPIIYDTDLLSFREAWAVDKNNNPQKTIDLPNYIPAHKNDLVSIKNSLPAALTDGTYLAFKSTNAFVHVYIEDELIYENENLLVSKAKMQPLSSWNFVPLSKDHAGKPISVTLKSPYTYYSGIIPEILMGRHSETLLYATSAASFDLQLGFSIVILGLLMFLFSIVSFTDESDTRGFIYLGANISLLGLMIISGIYAPYTDLRSYLANDLLMNFCLRIIPLTYTFYLILHGGLALKKIYSIAFFTGFLNFLISVLLYLFSIADFTATGPISYTVMLSVFALGLYGDLTNSSAKSLRYKILVAIGTGAFIMLAVLEFFTHITYMSKFPVSPAIAGALIFSLLQMTAVLISVHDRTREQLKIQKEYNENKIKLMISQIQPHFIYNTLTTIRIMTKRNPDKAYKMIYDFANYLSYNFNSLEDVPLVPFSEELKHIKTYTALESERFFDRLKIVYDIQADKFTVPPLSVQPYVENSIKHGLCKKPAGGTVTIKSFETADNWVINIIDDGVGFDPRRTAENKRGVGIKNTGYRLSSLLGASVELDSEKGKGAKVVITIPKKRRNVNEDNFG